MRTFLVLALIGALAVGRGWSSVEDSGETIISVENVKPDEDVMYITPETHPDVFFAEHFDDVESFERKWVKSQAKKNADVDESLAKYDGIWVLEQAQKDPLSGDLGLVLKSKAKHAAISARLRKPFKFSDAKPFIIQYELNLQNGLDCGGGYLKLLSHSKELDLRNFHDKTPYTIMFGPDKCGSDSKLHFIFRHVNPKNLTIQEKHCKKLDTKERSAFEEYFKDKKPHLYRLILRPDNTFEMSIDYKIVNHGSLMHDFDPPINPPAEVDDPNDKKPEDWDEREKILDPDASKPDDWDENQPKMILDKNAVKPEGWLDDEPEMIPDPSAEKPDDWDDELDGEWEAPLVENPACSAAPGCGKWSTPLIDNPKYKGKWKPPMVNNPNYKGKWKAKKIPNPEYFYDNEPFLRMTPIGAIGIELWSMSDDIYFDNILLTDSQSIADSWAAETYDLKIQKLDANDAGIFRRILLYSNRNPWLYAVYVVVVGLPLVLIVTFCCSGPSDPGSIPKANGKKALNDPKKTDEIQEDDEEVAEEEEEDEEGADEEGEGPEDRVREEQGDEEPLIERRTSPRKRRARKE